MMRTKTSLVVIIGIFFLTVLQTSQVQAWMIGEFEIPPKRTEVSEDKKKTAVGNGAMSEIKKKVKKPKAGQIRQEPVTGMELVWVPGGCYVMGSDDSDASSDEKPAHKVCLEGFWIGKYEVTQEQWRKIRSDNPSHFKKQGNLPVENVSWHDCRMFIIKLNLRSGKKFRLPTEAEWEYAALSGGRDEKFAGGNNLDELGWYSLNSLLQSHPVGRKKANGLGLFDMSGNLWEWCEDWYDAEFYGLSSQSNPSPLAQTGSRSVSSRVIRGGGWLSTALDNRCRQRDSREPHIKGHYLGFRLVLQDNN